MQLDFLDNMDWNKRNKEIVNGLKFLLYIVNDCLRINADFEKKSRKEYEYETVEDYLWLVYSDIYKTIKRYAILEGINLREMLGSNVLSFIETPKPSNYDVIHSSISGLREKIIKIRMSF